MISTRPISDQNPQVLPVLHDADVFAFSEKELPPDTLDAKVEILFLTCWLLHDGQMTLLVSLPLRSSSSKG